MNYKNYKTVQIARFGTLTSGRARMHEIGHLTKHHAKWADVGRILMTILRTLMSFVVATMAGWIGDKADQSIFLETFGWVIGYGLARRLVVVSAIDPWLRASLQALSRHFEFEADAAALDAGLGIPLLAVLGILRPLSSDHSPLYKLLYRSHPDASSRIERIQKDS